VHDPRTPQHRCEALTRFDVKFEVDAGSDFRIDECRG
jgi:hypothetical protein